MFFGCLPCCGDGGVACPNHENLGIAGPLSVISTARLVQAAGYIYTSPNDILLFDQIDTGYLSGDSQFIFTYQTADWVGDGFVTPRQLVITSPKYSASATIRTSASLSLPGR